MNSALEPMSLEVSHWSTATYYLLMLLHDLRVISFAKNHSVVEMAFHYTNHMQKSMGE